MAVAAELMLVGIEDIPPLAEARQLRALVRSLRARRGPPETLAVSLEPIATAILVLALDGVHSRDIHSEMMLLAKSMTAVDELRHDAWIAYRRGTLFSADFDDLMITSSRCRVALGQSVQAARRRGRRTADGAWPICPSE